MGVMTRGPERGRKQRREPTGDYEVGNCRPPKSGQIKKGEVRNKTGKNGKEKKPVKPVPIPSVAHIGADILSQTITVTIDGKQAEISYMRYLLEQDLRKAIKSDAPISRVLEAWGRLGILEELADRRNMSDLDDTDPDELPEAFRKAVAMIEGNWEINHPGEDMEEVGRRNVAAMDAIDDDGEESTDLDDGYLWSK